MEIFGIWKYKETSVLEYVEMYSGLRNGDFKLVRL